MVTTKDKVILSEENLSIEDLVLVARFNVPLMLSDSLKKKIKQSRRVVEHFIKQEKVIYGITTGVGDNSHIKINTTDAKKLQKNLIQSHACGVGENLSIELVRAVMVMMARNLSLGYSGVRLEVIESVINLLNKQITPLVPQEGSLGYLSYQAHISLVLLGSGQAHYDGNVLDGGTALKKAGLQPIELHEKEGLSLINGTADMTGLGAVAVYDSLNVLKAADIVSMISFEALRGTKYAFDPRISKVKPHPGQHKTIANLNKIIQDSEIAETFKNYRTQDALSIRAIPQVHGACKDAVHYTKQVIEREMNSATDNPLVFDEENGGVALSSANCHGEPVAIALDFLAISMSEIANVGERRVFRLVSPQYSELPPFLVNNEGVNSGYMIPQYVAAALVSDNKVYAHPASVDSIPTTAGQEDHVSMGTSAALKVLKIMTNTERVIGIELMCSSQGIEFLEPLSPGVGTGVARDVLRRHTPTLHDDRILYEDIQKAEMLVHSGELVRKVEEKIGPLLV